MTPPEESGESNLCLNNEFEKYGHIRRSLSFNDIAVSKNMEKAVQENKLQDIFPRPTGSTQNLSKPIELFIKEPMTPPGESCESNGHIRRSLSCNNIVALKNIEEEIHKSNLDDNMSPRPTGSTQDLSKTKIVSMAEAKNHFQGDTLGCSRELTWPQSQMLRYKDRLHPVHHLKHKEREQEKLKEIQKIKFKANPIPKSVLEGTKPPKVPKKPITVPVPFKLTEIRKKPIEQLVDKVQSSKAHPRPKHVLENSHIPIKKPVHGTKPCIQKSHYQESATAVPVQAIPASQTGKPTQRRGLVKPEPFSFEKRDEHLRKLKEEKIQRQIEEEQKKATQFKARPMPEGVKKRKQ